MKTKWILGAMGAICTPTAFASTDPAVVAKAEQLLKAADEKLASDRSLQATYTEIEEYSGDYQDLRQTGTLSLSRDKGYRLEINRARRVKASDPWKDTGNRTLAISDGSHAYSVFFHAQSTQVRSVDSSHSPKLDEVPLLAGFFVGNHSPAAALEAANEDGSLTHAEVDGPRIQFQSGILERTIQLGDDGLIHRLVLHNERTNSTRTWTLDSIVRDKPLNPAIFSYKVPGDAIPFPVGERGSGLPAGELAPDFADPSSDHRTIHLSDFKGKVVVLEFWATWCWPCNQSIPETDRLVSKYRDQGVESLLVSIKDNRQGFDSWIRKHPQFRDLRFVYDDPIHGQAYEAFDHPNNPTLYVIGRDGTIRLKKQGYTGPSPEVEEAIRAAL